MMCILIGKMENLIGKFGFGRLDCFLETSRTLTILRLYQILFRSIDDIFIASLYLLATNSAINVRSALTCARREWHKHRHSRLIAQSAPNRDESGGSPPIRIAKLECAFVFWRAVARDEAVAGPLRPSAFRCSALFASFFRPPRAAKERVPWFRRHFFVLRVILVPFW